MSLTSTSGKVLVLVDALNDDWQMRLAAVRAGTARDCPY